MSADEIKASGFAPEDFHAEDYEVWPENWAAWVLFCKVSTQWRVGGMGGHIGLDYTPLFRLMDADGLTGSDWQSAFDDIRTIEAAALSQIRENSNG